MNLNTVDTMESSDANLVTSGVEMDGKAWNSPPSMGADEVYDADFNGTLSVTIHSPQTVSFVGRSWNFTGQITGRAAGLAWAWSDGSTATNVSYFTSHSWTNAGNYTVTFTAYNNNNPGGISTNMVIDVLPLTTPQLQLAAVLANGFQFQFTGQSNANYTIQYTTNLTPPVTWQTLQTIYNSTGGVYQITDSTATNGTRFYRALAQ